MSPHRCRCELSSVHATRTHLFKPTGELCVAHKLAIVPSSSSGSWCKWQLRLHLTQELQSWTDCSPRVAAAAAASSLQEDLPGSLLLLRACWKLSAIGSIKATMNKLRGRNRGESLRGEVMLTRTCPLLSPPGADGPCLVRSAVRSSGCERSSRRRLHVPSEISRAREKAAKNVPSFKMSFKTGF